MRFQYVEAALKQRTEALESILRSGVGKGLDLAVYDAWDLTAIMGRSVVDYEYPELGGMVVRDVGFIYEWLTPGSKPTLARKCVIYKLSEYKKPVMATMAGEWDADGREVAP